MRQSGFDSKKVWQRLPQAILYVYVWMYVSVNVLKCMCMQHYSIQIVLLPSATVVRAALAHIASGHTQSLHFKDSKPLFCYPDRAESQLCADKTFKTGRRKWGVFWVLNNVKREEKYFFSVSCRLRPLNATKDQWLTNTKEMWFKTKLTYSRRNVTVSYLM